MSERIEQLYITALSESFDDSAVDWKERFAELIVKECNEVISNKGEYFTCDANKWQLTARIKEHFGFE